MLRRLMIRPVAATSHERRSFASPVILGLTLWLGFPTVAAYQDMASFVSGTESSQTRWNAYVETAVAGSVHSAEMPFTDSITTGSIAGAGLAAEGIGQVSFKVKGGAAGAVPDEERILRADKKSRLVKVLPVTPPRAFEAGALVKGARVLLRPVKRGDVTMAFAKSAIRGKELEIANAFYLKTGRKSDPGVPTFLADLVNNEKADILATAYAPAEPDYARKSPFQTLLGGDDADGGRFVPPRAKGDHDWMSKPLPEAVFGAAEQKCLANAIYFEARGESLRGQAAVAQVVLNRVRNPAYPSSICGVVYQNDQWKNRCQFSFACDGKADRITSPRNYKVAQDIAMAVTAGKIFLPEIGSSTHYYASYVSPSWARSMQKMKKIGLHIFYRTYGGGWS